MLPAAGTDILLGAACPAGQSASVSTGEAVFGPVVMKTSHRGLLTLRRPEAALALMDGAAPPPRAGRADKQRGTVPGVASGDPGGTRGHRAVPEDAAPARERPGDKTAREGSGW